MNVAPPSLHFCVAQFLLHETSVCEDCHTLNKTGSDEDENTVVSADFRCDEGLALCSHYDLIPEELPDAIL